MQDSASSQEGGGSVKKENPSIGLALEASLRERDDCKWNPTHSCLGRERLGTREVRSARV
jgi:hypothetical protein